MMQIVNQHQSLMKFLKYNSVDDLTQRSLEKWRSKFPDLDVCCQYPPPLQSGVEKLVRSFRNSILRINGIFLGIRRLEL